MTAITSLPIATPALLERAAANLPAAWRELPIFIGFRLYVKENGRIGKEPLIPGTNRHASSTNPRTHRPLDVALADCRRRGLFLGLALPPGHTLVDEDETIAPDGTIAPATLARIRRFDSLTLRSISETGTHTYVAGYPPENATKPADVELYPGKRFVLWTGNVIDGRDAIEDRTEILAQLFPPAARPMAPLPELTLDDEIIEERVLRMAKGRQLHGAGDPSGYASRSEAIFAILNIYICAGVTDPSQLDRHFRQSALYPVCQDRWDDERWRELTLANVLDGTVVPFEGWGQGSAATITRSSGQPTEPASDPCGPVRDELAELRAENARLRAELAQTKRDLSAVIKVIGNPNLGGDAAGKALVLAATYVQAQRTRVHSDDGYYRVTASKVADNREWIDGEDGERVPVPVPAQVSPRTVTKYMAIAQERGLIPAEKRTVRVPKGEADFPVDVWHWKAAPTLADQLAPLTGGTVYDDDNPRPLRGGDPKQRRIAPIPGCPECGGHHVACTSCGVTFDAPVAIDLDTRETLTADEADQELEERRHTVPTRVRPIRSVATRNNGETSLQSARKAPESGRLTAWRDRFARNADDVQEQDDPVAGTVGRPENPPLPGMDLLPDPYAEYAPGAD